jgi:carbonic anhydrase
MASGNQQSFFALKAQKPAIDMQKFVSLLDFNRRWTYQGSLTTIPCSEGILWNVIEEVIPIR